MPQVCLDFVEDVVPYLDAAYNLAGWLTRKEENAQDVVQEAFMRAFRFIGGFRGDSARAWLLRIVRDTYYTWMHQNRPQHPTIEFDEEFFGSDLLGPAPKETISRNDCALLRRALQELPPRHREVLILRQLEGIPYKEISEIMDILAGTVLSRLARARHRLRQSVANLGHEDSLPISRRVVAESSPWSGGERP